MTVVTVNPSLVPSSGSVDFTVNRDEIIGDALRRILKDGGLGGSPNTDQITDAAKSLNYIVKQIPALVGGDKMWLRKAGFVFLQDSQVAYQLGPTGDTAASVSFNHTTISANEASGQTVISLTSVADITAEDFIGIELDSGAVHWSTVDSVGLNTATLVLATTGAASAGNVVYTYTNQIRRPLRILTANMRDVNGLDTSLRVKDIYQYQSLSNKTAVGTPTSVYYQADIPNGTLYTDLSPDDVTRYIQIVYLSQAENFNESTDTPDFAQEWLKPLRDWLAYDLWPEYRAGERPQWLKDDKTEALALAEAMNPHQDNGYFEPGRD